MDPINAQTTLADLAVTHAGASRVFHRYGLDFCCHGNVSLKDVCEKRGIDFAKITEEIGAEDAVDNESFDRWDERPLDALIDHILKRFHESHRSEIPRLIEMAERVEKVHHDKATCPKGVAGVLHEMQGELGQHMMKEEQILFPMILSGQGSMATGPVQVMEHEHEEAGKNLARLRELTSDYDPPEEACKTWRALFLGLGQFEKDLMQHIHLENNVLFPRALSGD